MSQTSRTPEIIRDEILEIQKAAFKIQDQNLCITPVFHKAPVNRETLVYLSGYFDAEIKKGECHDPYIVINTRACNVVVKELA